MASDDRAAQGKPRRARVRSGCVRCRTKRRKCDELKPVCSRCREKKEVCQWGARIVFREENNHSLNTLQLSLKNKKRTKSSSDQFEIQDITAKVIQDQQQQDTVESSLPSNDSAFMTRNRTSQMADESVKLSNDIHTWEVATGMDTVPVLAPDSTKIDDTYQQSLDLAVTDTLTALPVDDLSYVWPSPTSLGVYDDSIFLPGSAYLDAHSTLRSHLIHEVNATSVTRSGTPELHQEHRIDLSVCVGASLDDISYERTSLTAEEEFILMKNWIEEVSPWLDKFDSQRHFQHTLPIMARSHAHLRYSILATSARQIERKERSTHTERSLALYQKAIQLVLPELHTRSTPVIASCVVLCVLEMQSSSPKAWRQHLDGCAYLIQASGIHGFSGGINQALFWCFERMDVCGGLITSMNTLIPIEHWAPGATLEAHSEFFRNASGFDAHACYAVYLCGRVLDLFTHQTQLASRVRASIAGNADILSSSHIARWTELWNQIDAWHCHRPDEMLPISSVDTQTLPFPQILYSNPAAISGNQLYHTASILMLQHKPPNIILSPKPRSIFWHARQICAISISNHHHGAWTNSIQPIWIAGQWMSHPSEQKAILELLERIERETGWGTKWRAEDLKEFWGN